jgi:hypothetical protein
VALVLIVAALIAAGAGGAAGGEGIPLNRVPKPVLDAVRARFKDARITGAEREREQGQLVYEIAIKLGDQTVDVTVTPEGTLLLIEKEIAVQALPAPVLRALERGYPGATYKVIEEVVKVQGAQEVLTHYATLLVTAQRKTLEVLVSPDGKILAEER